VRPIAPGLHERAVPFIKYRKSIDLMAAITVGMLTKPEDCSHVTPVECTLVVARHVGAVTLVG
jgi:hypothetical protein